MIDMDEVNRDPESISHPAEGGCQSERVSATRESDAQAILSRETRDARPSQQPLLETDWRGAG
jgi:hypothetical protein